MNTNFKVIGLTQLGIKPKSTALIRIVKCIACGGPNHSKCLNLTAVLCNHQSAQSFLCCHKRLLFTPTLSFCSLLDSSKLSKEKQSVKLKDS